MPDLFSITAPLTIRAPGEEPRVIAQHFSHEKGVLIFELYWDRGNPEEKIHILEGEVSGDGPWKVGDVVLNVLGCHGSEPALAVQYEEWLSYQEAGAEDFPPLPLIEAIARKFGATTV